MVPHTIALPVELIPTAPAGAQNEPGWTTLDCSLGAAGAGADAAGAGAGAAGATEAGATGLGTGAVTVGPLPNVETGIVWVGQVLRIDAIASCSVCVTQR